MKPKSKKKVTVAKGVKMPKKKVADLKKKPGNPNKKNKMVSCDRG